MADNIEHLVDSARRLADDARGVYYATEYPADRLADIIGDLAQVVVKLAELVGAKQQHG